MKRSTLPVFGMNAKIVAVAVLLVCCSSFAAARSPKALKSLGQGHRMTSVYNFEDGTGFVADLELITRTEIYGPDISPLRMVVRYAAYIFF
jgi:hypothetical protein